MAYLRSLPSRAVPLDVFTAFPRTAESLLECHGDERALHDAVAVCALFNLMNRLVEGLGFTADSEYFRLASERPASGGYAGLRELLREG
jgi:hypothetical protein